MWIFTILLSFGCVLMVVPSILWILASFGVISGGLGVLVAAIVTGVIGLLCTLIGELLLWKSDRPKMSGVDDMVATMQTLMSQGTIEGHVVQDVVVEPEPAHVSHHHTPTNCEAETSVDGERDTPIVLERQENTIVVLSDSGTDRRDEGGHFSRVTRHLD